VHGGEVVGLGDAVVVRARDEAPTPRKFGRSVAQPSSRKAFASVVTTLLSAVPP
jgi:hypothetical protein